ncbi:unnamed protein product, partial [Closterium sp. NIES-64]
GVPRRAHAFRRPLRTPLPRLLPHRLCVNAPGVCGQQGGGLPPATAGLRCGPNQLRAALQPHWVPHVEGADSGWRAAGGADRGRGGQWAALLHAPAHR